MSDYCLWNDPWHNCNKQECQGPSFHKVICDTSMISANARILLGEFGIVELLLNILTIPFGRMHALLKICGRFSQKLSRTWILSINSIITEYNTTLFKTVFIFQIKNYAEEQWINMCVSWELNFSNKTFQTLSHDKLINQAFYQHTRQITLIINNKCWQGSWPFNLFCTQATLYSEVICNIATVHKKL